MGLYLDPINEQPDGTVDGFHVWFEVTVERAGGWRVAYRLFPRDGQIIVAEVRVFPLHGDGPDRRPGEWSVEDRGLEALCPEGGITARLLRDEVILGKHIYQELPELWRRIGGGSNPMMRKVFDTWIGALGFGAEITRRGPRRGPKGWPDEEYAELADAYVQRYEAGSRSPVADVAASRRMSPGALRAALHRARERGLLTRQTPGRAGGKLTPKAAALLRKTTKKKKATKKKTTKKPTPKKRTRKGKSR